MLKRKLLKQLHLDNAYGQLIALIFIPIAVLATVGTMVIFSETSRAEKEQQKQFALALLSRNEVFAQIALSHLDALPWQNDNAQEFMDDMIREPLLVRTALINQKGENLLNAGYESYKNWPKFPQKQNFWGPIEYNDNYVYGLAISNQNEQKVWLVVELDGKPLQISRYRVVLVLTITSLITLLLLLTCLNFYSRRWIAPMFEMRLQLQKINVDTLDQNFTVNSTGELRLLQRDIANLIKRLNFSFFELKEYTEQTEEDLRKTLDTLEIQNITYRQARDQAIHSSQAKSVFLANISHELRTPLNSIDGFIHLLLRQGHLNNEQTLYLETIRKSSAHLLALINDVLDFSKIDAGKLELETAKFNLEEAIYDVMDMLSPLAAQKNIHMAFYFSDQTPTHVIGDVLRFKQIVTNLISNAIKFTPDGEIIVRTRLEHYEENKAVIHFSVQDSGIGLSGADRKNLFDSFSQGDTSITRQFGGTGLGLAISKQLVHLMHGQIGFADNQERAPTEKGSTFWFTVKLERDDENEVVVNYHDLQVISFLSHTATASILRHYLDKYQVQHIETQSILDFFNQLNQFKNLGQNTWVIVDHGNDLTALLKEIRSRYHGNLAIYGYQMALDLNLLQDYQAKPLYQPLSRPALLALLENKPTPTVEMNPQFNGQGLHLLAVDDHLPNLLVLEALLAEINVKMTKALSGQEALEILQQRFDLGKKPFDLIFMDLQMPVMSGIDTTRAIRSFESTRTNHQAIPIVALTAHALSDEKQRILKVGMNDYVTKPIQLDQIIQILNYWTTSKVEEKENIDSPTTLAITDQSILDWSKSLQLAANKEDLALDLLRMLVDSFDHELDEMNLLIELEDFPQLEQIVHRLYGATRYVGAPQLQEITGEFEQFLSILRKEQRKADEVFIEQALLYFHQLETCIEQVKQAAQLIFDQYELD